METMRASERSLRYRQAGRDAVFLLLVWPVLLVAFCVVVPLLALGLGASLVWIGLPVLVVALHISSGAAALGRWAVAAVDSSAYLPGTYRRPVPGDGSVRRLLMPLSDRQRWRDALWVIAAFVVSLGTWCVAVAWIAVVIASPVGFVVEVIIDPTSPTSQNLAELLGLEPDLLWMGVFYVTIAAVFIRLAPAVLRGLARVNQSLARTMLCGSTQVSRLRSSRAAVQRAEADTRRQLERDIHDGPQQRLVRLRMDLARAQRQAEKDPVAASAIIRGAMDQTQQTLDELRQLSRGIAPPVLVDRGLEAALAETAARSSVPVTVRVRVPRLPEYVEQAAYFVASEALANVNKHSGASRAELGAAVDGALLRLWVSDDGVGGASLSKGHGLTGLAQRLEGVDGQLSVISPVGGPTTVQAVIPCVF